MKANRIFLPLALFLSANVFGQQICRRVSLFFEHDQSELTAASIKKLDSIAAVISRKEYLIELYGHTDTVGRNAYNDNLALQRMKSIETYLNAKTGQAFAYKEKNFSETNAQISRNTEANLAYNRRVDLFLLPVQNGMLLLKGKNPSENVEVPVDYFEPCGLCRNQPEFKSYYSEKDASGTNITFETSDGFKLQTAGTMMLDYKPCGGVRRKDTASIVFRICDGKPDQQMTLWSADTVNGKIVWKPSQNKFRLDPLTGCYVFRAPAGSLYNLDKIDWDTVYSLELPQQFAYYHVIVTDRKKALRYNEEKDSIAVKVADTTCLVHGFAKKGDQVYLLKARMDSLPKTLQREGRVYARAFEPSMSSFRPLTYSDTLLKIKGGRSARQLTFGFYLPEYKEFIPMDSTGGVYSMDHKPNCEYQYGYLKNGRLYVISNKKVRAKYARSSNTLQMKFNRRNRKHFHRVADYKPKNGRMKPQGRKGAKK